MQPVVAIRRVKRAKCSQVVNIDNLLGRIQMNHKSAFEPDDFSSKFIQELDALAMVLLAIAGRLTQGFFVLFEFLHRCLFESGARPGFLSWHKSSQLLLLVASRRVLPTESTAK